MSKNVICEGYTRPGYIEPVERLHEELRFTYRPLTQEQIESLSERLDKSTLSAEKATSLIAAAVARQIVDWSEVGADDKPLPVTVDNVKSLHPSVFTKLRRIVSGERPSDADPKAVAQAARDPYLDELDKMTGTEAAEALRKN